MNLIDAAKEGLGVLQTIWEDGLEGTSVTAHITSIENLGKAIEEAEKNQFNPDWDAVKLLSDENLALHRRIAELEQKLQEQS